MIRNTILFLLTMAAVAAWGVSVLSYFGKLHTEYNIDNAAYRTKNVKVSFHKGQTDVMLKYPVNCLNGRKIKRRDWSMGKFAYASGLSTSPRHRDGTSLYARCYTLRFPLSAAILLLGLYPSIVFICGPLRTQLRRRRGLCVKCTYNLTGNVSGTCPECGAEVKHR